MILSTRAILTLKGAGKLFFCSSINYIALKSSQDVHATVTVQQNIEQPHPRFYCQSESSNSKIKLTEQQLSDLNHDENIIVGKNNNKEGDFSKNLTFSLLIQGDEESPYCESLQVNSNLLVSHEDKRREQNKSNRRQLKQQEQQGYNDLRNLSQYETIEYLMDDNNFNQYNIYNLNIVLKSLEKYRISNDNGQYNMIINNFVYLLNDMHPIKEPKEEFFLALLILRISNNLPNVLFSLKLNQKKLVNSLISIFRGQDDKINVNLNHQTVLYIIQSFSFMEQQPILQTLLIDLKPVKNSIIEYIEYHQKNISTLENVFNLQSLVNIALYMNKINILTKETMEIFTQVFLRKSHQLNRLDYQIVLQILSTIHDFKNLELFYKIYEEILINQQLESKYVGYFYQLFFKLGNKINPIVIDSMLNQFQNIYYVLQQTYSESLIDPDNNFDNKKNSNIKSISNLNNKSRNQTNNSFGFQKTLGFDIWNNQQNIQALCECLKHQNLSSNQQEIIFTLIDNLLIIQSSLLRLQVNHRIDGYHYSVFLENICKNLDFFSIQKVRESIVTYFLEHFAYFKNKDQTKILYLMSQHDTLIQKDWLMNYTAKLITKNQFTLCRTNVGYIFHIFQYDKNNLYTDINSQLLLIFRNEATFPRKKYANLDESNFILCVEVLSKTGQLEKERQIIISFINEKNPLLNFNCNPDLFIKLLQLLNQNKLVEQNNQSIQQNFAVKLIKISQTLILNQYLNDYQVEQMIKEFSSLASLMTLKIQEQFKQHIQDIKSILQSLQYPI